MSSAEVKRPRQDFEVPLDEKISFDTLAARLQVHGTSLHVLIQSMGIGTFKPILGWFQLDDRGFDEVKQNLVEKTLPKFIAAGGHLNMLTAVLAIVDEGLLTGAQLSDFEAKYREGLRVIEKTKGKKK